MTRARNQQVSLSATPYYHCISRCVRRAYLCGEDPVSQQNFDHRKLWLVEKVKELRDSGMGSSAISKEMGIGRASIYRALGS